MKLKSVSGGMPPEKTIVPTDLSKTSVILEKTRYTYDGKAKIPAVKVVMDGKILILNTDYTVAYSDNTIPTWHNIRILTDFAASAKSWAELLQTVFLLV